MAEQKRTTKKTSGRRAEAAPPDAHHGGHEHDPSDPCQHQGGHDHATDEACPECFIASRQHHHDFDHFPSDLELADHGVETRVASEPEILRRLTSSRFANQESVDTDMADAITHGVAQLRVGPAVSLASSRIVLQGPWISGLIRYLGSFRRVRRDHRLLDRAQRQTFNNALAALDGNPAWQTLMNYHVGGVYRMHSMHGPVGTQRFLSWHRQYLFQAEQMLRAVEPTITIPYWDYASDGSRPDWVHQPAGVTRPAPGAPGFLPSGAAITTILGRGDYTGFTVDLENNAHNQVHNWCKGTLQNPSTASFDPIFWLLHGNVDRLWAIWQETHDTPGVHAPAITGSDRVLDPWAATITDVDDTAWDLGYRYA
jgi:hypothetical protein